MRHVKFGPQRSIPKASQIALLEAPMDVSPAALVHAVAEMKRDQTTSEVQIQVLKKAQDIQSSSAMAMLNALPAALPLASGGSLGTQVNALV